MQGVPEPNQDPNFFTVVVRDRTYRLSGQQIMRDAPNYFSSHFLDRLGQRRVLVLHICRDPLLFELILRYINGYQLFPFHSKMFPSNYPAEVVMADLCADAESTNSADLLGYAYPRTLLKKQDLDHRTLWCPLIGILPTAHNRQPVTLSLLVTFASYRESTRVILASRCICERELFVLNFVPIHPAESFEVFIPRFSMVLLSDAHFDASSKKMSTVTKAALDKVSPHNITVASWSERIVRAVLCRDTSGVERWELLCWKKDVANEIRNSAIFVKLWVGPGFSVNA